MQQWEYRVVKINGDAALVEVDGKGLGAGGFLGKIGTVIGPHLFKYLNEVGKEGWEVVGFDGSLVILKRSIASSR